MKEKNPAAGEEGSEAGSSADKKKRSSSASTRNASKSQSVKEVASDIAGEATAMRKHTISTILPEMWSKSMAFMSSAAVQIVEEGLKNTYSDFLEDPIYPKQDVFFREAAYRAAEHNEVCVITGGAGAIGKAIAREFLYRRFTVVIADIHTERLNTAEAELNAMGMPGKVVAIECDITSEDSMQNLFTKATALGRVSILVANAGVVAGKSQMDATDKFSFVMETNVVGTQRTLRTFVPYMTQTKEIGHVIVTGNNAALYAHTQGAFGVACAAIKSMVDSLSAELVKEKANVHTHLLLGGVVKSNVIVNSSELMKQKLGTKLTEEEGVTLAKMQEVYDKGCTPEEVAAGVINGIRRNYPYISSHQVATRMAVADHFAAVNLNERRGPIRFGATTYSDPENLRRKSDIPATHAAPAAPAVAGATAAVETMSLSEDTPAVSQ